MRKLYALAVLIAAVGAAPQKGISKDKTEVLDEAESLVLKLSETSKLDRKVAFRCGMFFPDPKDPSALPVSPLLIFNASWPAEECSTSGPDYEKYNNHCSGLFGKFSNTLSLSDPSIRSKNREKGSTIGNDICRYVKKEVKAPFVGGKSKKFPDGLKIGMFSNACGDETWQNSGKYHSETLCCKGGNYYNCDE